EFSWLIPFRHQRIITTQKCVRFARKAFKYWGFGKSVAEPIARRSRAPPRAGNLFPDAVAVENAIPRADVDAAVGFGKLTEVQPRLDVIAARPQRFAGFGIECIEGGVRGGWDAALGGILQADIRVGLRRGLAAGVTEDDSVGDHRRFALIEITRHPGGIERDLAVAVIHDFERHDAALLYGTVLNRHLEVRVLRAPERAV